MKVDAINIKLQASFLKCNEKTLFPWDTKKVYVLWNQILSLIKTEKFSDKVWQMAKFLLVEEDARIFISISAAAFLRSLGVNPCVSRANFATDKF